jgi:hypothetical protein
MSADGEVEVSVRAEGVDQAAGEMGGETLAQTGDGAAAAGPPGGGGGRGGAGRFGKLLTRIATLLAFLGPILKVLGVASNILESFVAPLAIVLLRLLQPALRLLIQVLPVWFDIVTFIGDVLKAIQRINIAIIVGILRLVRQGVLSVVNAIPDDLKSAITSLPGDIWDQFDGLANDIGTQVAGALNLGGGGDAEVGDLTPEQQLEGAEAAQDVSQALGRVPGLSPVSIAISGGLDAFIERIERDPNKDIQ